MHSSNNQYIDSLLANEKHQHIKNFTKIKSAGWWLLSDGIAISWDICEIFLSGSLSISATDRQLIESGKLTTFNVA